MPIATRVNDTNSSVATADHLTLPTYTRLNGAGSVLVGLVAYNDSWLANPATSWSYGADNLSVSDAQASSLGNVSVEIWTLPGPTETSAAPIVSWPGGTNLSIIACFVELGFASQRAATFLVSSSGASGLVSPLTVTYTSAGSLQGVRGTVVSPATDAILLAMGVDYTAGTGSTLSLTSGTTLMNPTTVGAGAAQITAAAAFTQATGGSDTISWSESIAAEWAMMLVEIAGATVVGMVKANSVIPRIY